ncbi:DUF4276 family protein [Leptolyngbya sp. AN03gr2]|uniref:DUF4276 family protein n=1 Tax=unclassified Leptolyngbya TaxID=2650499 RepID=UPI003D31BC32
MKIAILVEGATEVAFKGKLCAFLKTRLDQRMPRLTFIPQNGRIPKEDKLRRVVENLLAGANAYDAVIALTDVYTGTNDFRDANDAKDKMREWANNPQFYPHTALHDFEAWLLPYWSTIQDLADHRRSAPSGSPEAVNHHRPPSYHIREIFRAGRRQDYSKPIHEKKILEKNELMLAIQACPELKSFVNTILVLCEGEVIP